MFSKIKKVTLALLIALVLGTSTLGSLALVQPAQATIPVSVAADLPGQAKDIIGQIYEGLKTAVLNAAVRLVAYAMRKVAYDSAVWLASGGKGQTPFAQTKSFGDYISNVGNEAFGKGIEELGKPYGLNLCQIPDIRADLKLKVGLRMNLAPDAAQETRKPTCSFTQFRENWLSEDKWKSQYGDTKSLAERFNASVSLDDSDLGIQLDASQKLDQLVLNERAGAQLQRLEGQGYLPKTTKISGDIQTPAGIIKKDFEKNTPGDQQEKDEQQIAAALGTGNIQVIPTVLQIFLNTLASSMAKNFQEKGVLPFGICVGDYGGEECKGSDASSYSSLGVVSGRRAAEELFTGFLETVNIAAVEEYDVLSQLSNCPDSAETYHCRADQRLVEAAKRADSGNPVTIAQAIKDGMLHDEWKLLPPERTVENTDKNCHKSAYCYSNIKVLRQVRLLPLGFEIAAKNSDPDRPWTLKQVVDNFNNCRRDASGSIVYDPVNHPFCHLIDPNWVIKVAPMRCNARVYGPIPLSGGVPDRLQECADLASCVAYNSDGTCKSFGYCTREKNTWRFDADKCEPQFATCRSYTDSDGKRTAYLYRTLDTGFCTQDNVGCRYYSLTQNNTGTWLPSSVNPTTYRNNGVYFNSQLSTSCSANSAGCSAFTVNAEDTRNLLYYRKAPDYLGCYDSNPTQAGVQWPANRADLRTINGRDTCKNYADVCIPEEVGCNLYTPVAGSGNTPVPGKFDAGDVCNEKCVGYDSYREMPSNYSNGQNLAYIIPSSGRECRSEEKGCSGFTNLSTDAGGVEKVEHFTYLRPCIKPDTTKQKNFITYEGSSSGFQLKVYTLVKDTDGSPKYFYRTASDRAQYDKICNETDYKLGRTDPDCRQFNDEQGTVYYRLLGKTIAVSDQCTPYRLNNTELYRVDLNKTACAAQKGFWSNGQCQVCFQGGEYRDGSCFYEGLPGGATNSAGNSVMCAASADTCREYKGNTGNNIDIKINDDFEGDETQAMEGWGPVGQVARSLESTRTDGHSVGSNGARTVARAVQLTPGKSYDLTFWAKGTSASVEVALTDANNQKSLLGSVAVSDAWNYYRVGPVEFVSNAPTTAAELTFALPNGATVFLDNVKLVEITDYIYRVKNSLRVDPVCDSNLNDNLPGEALGCTAYKDLQGRPAQLTNFSTICRENAIGCTALFDVQNTPNNRGPELRQVWLTGAAGNTLTLTYQGRKVGECRVEGGQSGCYIKSVEGVEPAALVANGVINGDAARKPQVRNSTVYIPADTPSSSPIYMVANREASCNQVDVGCVAAGAAVDTPKGTVYSTTTIKNDPSSYDKTLCQSEALGCNAYSGSDGTVYFKDPALTGQKVCAYQKDVVVNGVKANGWFWKGLQMCSGTNTICTKESECAAGKKCEAAPCYPTYFNGGTYGIWSYGDVGKYDNFVGECPATEDKCTEFVDHNDNNQSYFFIKNERIDTKTCNGSVSQKAGCVLFDQTDVPSKLWSTRLTYEKSSDNDGQSVQPEKGALSDRDSNIVIKVKQDRECGEWLQCRSSYKVWDDKKGAWKSVCQFVGRCSQAAAGDQSSDVSNCAEWVDGNHDYANKILTTQEYVSRNVTWEGMDFTGYSLLDSYPVEELTQLNFSTSTINPDWRLVKRVACGGRNCDAPRGEFGCARKGDACGKDGEGVCIENVCVRNFSTTKSNISTATRQSCRAFPEPDSPFPNTPLISPETKGRVQGFANIHFCNETSKPNTDPTKSFACECSYTKVTYGDVLTKYWNYLRPNVIEPTKKYDAAKPQTLLGQPNPEGICSGGDSDGKACDTNYDCFSKISGRNEPRLTPPPTSDRIIDGTCVKKKRETGFLGWYGFCLEEDSSKNINGNQSQHPCLTWYPVDALVGSVDVNGQDEKAGYQNLQPAGGRYYCLGTSGEDVELPGGFIRIDTEKDNDGESNDFAVKSIAPNNLMKDIYKQDIEKIIFIVGERDTEDPNDGEMFEIWPNDQPEALANAQQTLYTIQPGANGPGHVVTGRYFQSKDEFILFYGSQNFNSDTGVLSYVDKDGRVCFPATNSKNQSDSSACREVKLFSAPRQPDWLFTANSFDCKNPNGNGNFHAVKVNFGPNGHLTGFNMSYCDRSGGEGQIKYFLRFKMKQWCKFIADTTVENKDAKKDSVAWTNRLWDSVRNSFTISNNAQRANSLGYKYDLPPLRPFGSLDITYSPLGKQQQVQVPPFRGPADANGKACNLRGNGVSAECRCPSGSTTKCEYFISWPFDIIGAPLSCGDGTGIDCFSYDGTAATTTPAKTNNLAAGQDNLAQIFARVWDVYEFKPQTSQYESVNNVGLNVTEVGDTKSISSSRPVPPRVYPLGDCIAGGCFEDALNQGITVNGKSSGDVKIFGSPAQVSIRFFAYADKNQMPLRQIRVNWDDKNAANPVVERKGMYRNQRGLLNLTCNTTLKHCMRPIITDTPCQTDNDCKIADLTPNATCDIERKLCREEETPPASLNCTNDDDCKKEPAPVCVPEANAEHFGLIEDRTCDNRYFEFNYVYSCSKNGLGWETPETCGTKDFPNGCCIYKPSVQVKDNWGWYNGFCPGGPDNPGGDGCYDRIWEVPAKRQDEGVKNGASTTFSGKILVAPN